MDKILKWLRGKKTHGIAILIVVLGLLQGLDIFTVPEWAWPIIAAAGLTALRLGVNKVADTIKPK